MGTADLPPPAQLHKVLARLRAIARLEVHTVREALAVIGAAMGSLERDADALQQLFDQATDELRRRAERIVVLEAELEAAVFVVDLDQSDALDLDPAEDPTPPPHPVPRSLRPATPPPLPRRDISTSMMAPDEMRKLGQQLIDAANGTGDIPPQEE